MGCPDWPKCFGSWVPPTSEDQLPEDYEEEYLNKRKEKVSRLATMLSKMGFDKKANEISNAPGQMESHAFNVRKTYTEYINRLWGAITGFLTLLAGISSLQYRKTKRSIPFFTWLGVLFVVFNGWLGSIVVDTNLLGGVVSAHFALAFLAIACFMIAYFWNKSTEGKSNRKVSRFILLGLLLSITQLLTGTNVREGIDSLAKSGTGVGLDNIHLLGDVFNAHRILAILLGICLISIWHYNRELTRRPKTSLIVIATIVILVIQALTGIANVRYDFPAIAQLLHVVLGSLTLVSFIYLTIHELKSKKLQYVN